MVQRGVTGEYIRLSGKEDEPVSAFVPLPLPPRPPLELGPPIRELLDRAHLELGRLDSVSTLLPDTPLLLSSYVRLEALLSSQIEGIQSSLSDLLLFELEEAPSVPFEGVVEVSNYVAALEHGIRRIREGFPLSSRLLREIHEILMARGRGTASRPGEFRTSQNWIGGSRPGTAAFVPPPFFRVGECMGELEKFLHDDPERTSPLIKAALAHVQFETIHPFLDGNGRVGRLLITLILCAEGILREPLLYLSLHFKRNRETYYERLGSIRLNGDWEEWLRFFLEAIYATAHEAVVTARQLVDLFQEDRRRVGERGGRRAASNLLILEALRERPIGTASSLAVRTNLSQPTVDRVLRELGELGLVREITGRRRHRVFAYGAYMDILNRGMTDA